MISVGVAMSGGVDSSVTAALLKKQGYRVHGFYMALAQPDLEVQVARVRNVAGRLGLDLEVIDLHDEFEEQVLRYFRESYYQGLTPNPCAICNRAIKFGLFRQAILAHGMDFMATGHYARIDRSDSSGPVRLLKGNDPRKDQSYFLCRLSQEQLSTILMPLGEYAKTRVYEMAAEIGIAGVHGQESQDVCFLSDNDVASFLAGDTSYGVKPGTIVTIGGRELGRHEGIHRYTVGQRRGLGLPDTTPYYVVGLDPLANRVIVGKKDDLLQKQLFADDINWMAGTPPSMPYACEVRIRYRHTPAPAQINMEAEGERLRISFEESQRAITPGQFAVIYQDDEVIGSGVICPGGRELRM
jgi:tRNA-specific 2-thiouridylase